MDTQGVMDAINTGGVLAVFVFIAVSGLKKIWVFGWTHSDMKTEYEKRLVEQKAEYENRLKDLKADQAAKDSEIKRMRDVFENKVLEALIAYNDVTQEQIYRERQRREQS